MGLFSKLSANATQSGNFTDAIRSEHDVDALIWLNPVRDFNTNSVIQVGPGEQALFFKNGELIGTLPSGRHEVKTENIPVFRRIREFFTGGASSFTCEVYHVSTTINSILWGTSNPIEVNDFYNAVAASGIKAQPMKAFIQARGTFRICFNVREDDNAAAKAFFKLVGNKSSLTADDLSRFFHSQLSSKISSLMANLLEEKSKDSPIDSITSNTEKFIELLTPAFEELFVKYGFELDDFSFEQFVLKYDEASQAMKERLMQAAYAGGYNVAVQQELLKDAVNNQTAGGIAGAGAGLGMGIAAGGAFVNMAQGAFGNMGMQQPMQQQYMQQQYMQQPMQQQYMQQPMQQPMQQQPMQQQQPAQADPMESLMKMKQMLDAGLITQEQYNAKVSEIMSRM